MRVYIEAHGCRVNEAERASWSRELHSRGHLVVSEPELAQVVVVNTCGVTSAAVGKSRRRLSRLRSDQPNVVLVATGCWATLEPFGLLVDLLLPNDQKNHLIDRLEAMDLPSLVEGSHSPIAAAPRTRAFLKVQDGCRNRCTFCVVTIARGDERSLTTEDVVRNVQELVEDGFKEVVLCGIHLGGYGADLGTNLTNLVEAILQKTDLPRLRLSSLEPWDVPSGLFDLWADSRLCPHLHLPIQSGSDSTLRRMARRATRDSLRRLVEVARSRVPDFCFTTDVMAGFPGETSIEFQETIDLLKELRPSDLHVFTFSARQKTVAASLPNQIGAFTKRERSRFLRNLAAEFRAQALEKALGTTRPVLWERRPRVLSSGELLWRGHTDTYLRVTTTTPMGPRMGNSVTQTLLTELETAVGLKGRIWPLRTDEGVRNRTENP